MITAAVSFAPKAGNKLNFENRIYSTSEKSQGITIEDTFIELAPFTSVKADRFDYLLTLKGLMGKLEVNIPAGKWVRFETGDKYLDITSMDGGRVKAEALMGAFQLRNVAGDLLVKEGSRTFRFLKSSFVQVSGGSLEISRLRMPEVLIPRLRERFFTLQPWAEIALVFRTAQYGLAKTEYVIYAEGGQLAAHGIVEGSNAKINLKPGNYLLTSRSKLGAEHSAWTTPREFSVWSKPGQVATAF